MQLRRISTIFRKDLRDAIRDARVLVALVIPLAIGLFYNFTFNDDTGTLTSHVAIYAQDSADSTALANEMTRYTSEDIELEFYFAADPDAVVAEVRDKNADLGLVLPDGFQAAVKNGSQPQIRVIQTSTSNVAGDYALATIEPALRAIAGQAPPATFAIESAAQPKESETAIDKVGLRNWSILVSIVMMIGMIAMLAVPVILAEETEKKTLDALVLIASYAEVVTAKAAIGIFYITVMVPLLLVLTTTQPVKVALFVAAVALLSVALIGFGLLMAGLFKSANQLNTWSGLLLLPVIAPAFAIGLPVPDIVTTIATALPTGAATKLMMNSMSNEIVFSNQAVSFAIVIAWAVLAFGLLLWQLSRRGD